MSEIDNRLKEYYEYLFDYPNAQAFDNINDGLKESIRQSWGFKRYNLSCSWTELKNQIQKAIVDALPKN